MKIGLYGDRTPPLGQLERAVLDCLWAQDRQGAQQVLEALASQREVTLSTVQTTLERLTRKGLLAREKQGRSYIYRALVSREGLLARMMSDLIGALTREPGPSAASFFERDESIDAETLDRLEQWIKARRNGTQEPS